MRIWLLALFSVSALSTEIGEISELRGTGEITRRDSGDSLTAELQSDILPFDDVRTGNGRLAIEFLDNSVVRLTEQSKLIIDEYIYDPDPSKSKMTMEFASGTARFITGKIGQINKQNINISTPTAQIAIRGTDFTVTVDEFGRSLVILLPDAEGLPSGEIVVSTAMGSVTLNKPYQSTVTTVWEQAPSSSVILDLTLDLIDNLLIVSPPKRNEEIEQTEGRNGSDSSSTNILDVDYLAYGELELDYLAYDELEFSELDIEYLDMDFLEDLLEIVEELDALTSEDQLSASVFSPINIQGTEYGNDPTTQITTFGDAETVTLIRQVNQFVQLDLNGQTAYNIIIEQDGKAYNVILNSGSDTTITIRQSGG